MFLPGSKMVGSKTKYRTKNGPVERLYYTCSQFHNKGVTACRSNCIRVDLIDPIAIKKIAKKLNSPELVYTLYKYITENTIDENSEDGKRRVLEIEIENLSKRKIELRRLYTEGIITASELKEDIEKINTKSKEYQSLLTDLEDEVPHVEPRTIHIKKQDIESFLSSIVDTLKTDIESECLKVKMLIRGLIDSITITSKHKLDMEIDIAYDEVLFRLLQEEPELQTPVQQ